MTIFGLRLRRLRSTGFQELFRAALLLGSPPGTLSVALSGIFQVRYGYVTVTLGDGVFRKSPYKDDL
jgi:hypothetical protein